MAINITRAQPVQPLANWDADVATEYELMQLMLPGSSQEFQIELSPATPPSPISVGGFTLSGGMTVVGSALSCTGAGTATINPGLVANTSYAITVRVSLSSLQETGGFRLRLNNQEVELADKGTTTNNSIISGTITTYHRVGTVTSSLLEIIVSGAFLPMTFQSISVTPLSVPELKFLDETKTELVATGFTISDTNRVNIKRIRANWTNVSNGIRYISVKDTVRFNTQLIKNGYFNASVADWEQEDGTALADWTWDAANGNSAYYDNGGGTSLAQTQIVPGGGRYTIDIDCYGNPILAVGRAYVRINGVKQPEISITGNTVGQIEVDLKYYTGFVNLQVVILPFISSRTLWIGEVVMKRVEDTGNISTPYQLGETNYKDTLALRATCAEPAHGLIMGNDLTLSLLVPGRLKYIDYPDKAENYLFSDRETRLLESAAEKEYQVTVHGSPEYLHDAIRLMRLCDTFTINGKEYISRGKYELKPTEGIDSAGAVFRVIDKLSLLPNEY